MNKATIEQPKVFISYAWGDDEFQGKVLTFVTDLIKDGVDVIFDRWSLKEGHDTYAFMEQSVTGSDVTNVLILLSPQYEKKANERSGGVGTETQIISPEIYDKVNQEKFLPIVFERGVDGEVHKPTFLKGRFHFDLSIDDRYDEEYQRLVKRLYGIEIIKKPELGKKPMWLETSTTVSVKTRNKYTVLQNNMSDMAKTELLISFLTDLKFKILDFKKDANINDGLGFEAYISLHNETKAIRDEFLLLMRYISYVNNGEILVASKLEEIYDELSKGHSLINGIQKTLLHELFIYIIAIYYKSKNYTALSYTITKTYFISGYHVNNAQSFNVFYNNNENLDNAICQRDNKKYHSGQAQYWIENINVDICNKSEFAFADVFCYNAAIFVENYTDSWKWFPLTYPYDTIMQSFAVKLKSKEHLSELTSIFGFNEIELFKKKFGEIEGRAKIGELNEYRFKGSFDSAPILCQNIKYEELGIRN